MRDLGDGSSCSEWGQNGFLYFGMHIFVRAGGFVILLAKSDYNIFERWILRPDSGIHIDGQVPIPSSVTIPYFILWSVYWVLLRVRHI